MTNSPIPELRGRPLPSFEQWLTNNGDGTRGDGYAGFEDLAKRTHDQPRPEHLTEDEMSFLRLWMGMQVAVIELSRLEEQRGRRFDQIVPMMARVLGATAMYSVASAVNDDSPYRAMAKVLIEDFRHGCKASADQLEERRGREGRP